jgi:hypothetical protein
MAHRFARRSKTAANSSRALLEHLKPEEAAEVLRRLLRTHADLTNEAERIAKAVLTQVDFEDTASAVEDAVTGVDIDDIYARAGKHEWGYVEPDEAAVEILNSALEPFIEDIQRQIDLGLEAESLEMCKGVVLGLYRAEQESEDEVLQLAPEFPAETAAYAIEVWLGERHGSGKRLKRGVSPKLPGFPQDFVDQFVPQWAAMISRILRGK